jgi:hypothetical protein
VVVDEFADIDRGTRVLGEQRPQIGVLAAVVEVDLGAQLGHPAVDRHRPLGRAVLPAVGDPLGGGGEPAHVGAHRTVAQRHAEQVGGGGGGHGGLLGRRGTTVARPACRGLVTATSASRTVEVGTVL